MIYLFRSLCFSFVFSRLVFPVQGKTPIGLVYGIVPPGETGVDFKNLVKGIR